LIRFPPIQADTIIMLVRDNSAGIAWFLSQLRVTPNGAGDHQSGRIPITPFISTTYPEINAAVTQKDLFAAAIDAHAHFRRLDKNNRRWAAFCWLGFTSRLTRLCPHALFLAMGLPIFSSELPFFPTGVTDSALPHRLWCGIAKIAGSALVPKLGLNFKLFAFIILHHFRS
jgi:hypothetical protein